VFFGAGRLVNETLLRVAQSRSMIAAALGAALIHRIGEALESMPAGKSRFDSRPLHAAARQGRRRRSSIGPRDL
jgi:hypothetical protein